MEKEIIKLRTLLEWMEDCNGHYDQIDALKALWTVYDSMNEILSNHG